MLAVTAIDVGGVLQIDLSAAGDTATLTYDSNLDQYTVLGNGPFSYTTTSGAIVNGIQVSDTLAGGAGGQRFILDSLSDDLTDQLTVTGVETVSINAIIDAPGKALTVTGGAFNSGAQPILAGSISILSADSITANTLASDSFNITLSATSGNIVTGDLASSKGIAVTTTTGEITTGDVEAQGLGITLTTASGNIISGDLDSQQNIALITTSGNITTGKLDVAATANNVTITAGAASTVDITDAVSATANIIVTSGTVITEGTVESTNGGTVTLQGSVQTWAWNNITTTGTINFGNAAGVTKIGNASDITLEGGVVNVTGNSVVFSGTGKATLESINGIVSLTGPATSSRKLTLTGQGGITTTSTLTLTPTASDLDMEAKGGVITLGDDVTVGNGAATITGALAAHKNVTSTGDLTVTNPAGPLTATGGSLFKSSAGKVTISSGAGNVDLGTLNVNANGNIDVSTTSGTIVSNGTLTSGSAVAVTANLNVTTGVINAVADVTLESQLGNVSAGATDSAQGDITLTAKVDIATTGAITAATGEILFQAYPIPVPPLSPAPARNISIGGDVTATKDVTVLASGSVALGPSVVVTGDTITITGTGISLSGDADLVSTRSAASGGGSISTPTSVTGTTSTDTLTLQGDDSLAANGIFLTTGSLIVVAGAVPLSSITLAGDVIALDGSISLTAPLGTILGHGDLLASGDITINAATFTAQPQQFKAGGTLTVAASLFDLDLSALTGVPAGAVGGTVTFSAPNGDLKVGSVNATQNITLSTVGGGTGDVTVVGDLIAGGNIDVTSAMDIEIDDTTSLTGNGSTSAITLTAGNVLQGGDFITPGPVSSTLLAKFNAPSLSLVANGSSAPSDVHFTNANNKVGTLSIKLQDATNVPNGTGIEFINDIDLVVDDAITNSGEVKLSSLNGTLTINAAIGGVSPNIVAVSGITLAGKQGVTIANTSGLTVGATGNVAVTSSAGPVALNAGISLVDGSLTVNAGTDLAVAAALKVDGAAGNISLTSGGDMTISADVTSLQGDITITATGGTTGLTSSAKIHASDTLTIIANKGATIGAVAPNPALKTTTGPISLTSATGNITVSGDVLAQGGSVTLTTATGDASVTGAVTANGTASDATITAPGGTLSVTNDVTAGHDITLLSRNNATIGTSNTNLLLARTGDVSITSTNADVALKSNAKAPLGSINVVATTGILTVTSTELTALPTNAGGPSGVITLTGGSKIASFTGGGPVLTAGRLEIRSGGNPPLALTQSNNEVGSLFVQTLGTFQFVNSAALQITDFNPLPSPQVTASSIDISSAQGLRVVDGLVYTGTLRLVTPVSGGVQYVTTSSGDVAAGFTGSLRNMIKYVNDNTSATANSGVVPTRSTITQEQSLLFDEAGAPVDGAGTITLTATLQPVLRPVTLDGTLATPGTKVTIDGAAVAGNGFTLGAGSSLSIIRDATFANFANAAGVAINSARNQLLSMRATGNGIGVDLSTSSSNRNFIGIQTIGETGNTFDSNKVGVQVRGGAAYNSIYGNTIDSNTIDGITVEASIGTSIGTTTDATFANAIQNNTRNGVRLTNIVAASVPYGASLLNNVISGNGAAGVLIEGGGRNQVGSAAANGLNTLTGNRDGIVLQSSAAGPTQGNSIASNTITNSTVDGIRVNAGFANQIRANSVSASGQAGIRVQNATASASRPANQVLGNTLTGNGDGTTAGDTGGIVLDSSSGQMIGGVAASGGNTITGSLGNGIVVRSSSSTTGGSNTITGNTITGSLADGVRIRTSNGNTVRANIVSGTAENGINVIGATASTAALGNKLVSNDISASTKAGIRLAGGARTTVGGTLTSLGNKVSGGSAEGVLIEANGAGDLPRFHAVQGNQVGGVGIGNASFGVKITSASDTTVDFGNVIRENAAGGVFIQGGARNTIGSSLPGRGNQILANAGNGISVSQPGTGTTLAVTVAGNTIQDNTTFGIEVSGARTSGVTIGRTPSVTYPNGSENTIQNNASGGIRVDAAQQVTIVGNAVWANGAASPADDIILANNANLNPTATIQAPTITSATQRLLGLSNPQYDVRGTVSGTPGQRFFVDLYGISPTGRMLFLGRAIATVGTGGTGSFRAIVGPSRQQLAGLGGINQIVATSTSASTFLGGTSVFSAATSV